MSYVKMNGTSRQSLVQFRVTADEHEQIRSSAKHRLESVSDFARSSTLSRTEAVRLGEVATRGELLEVSGRMQKLEHELQQVIRHINRLGDIMESARQISAAAVASSAFLRVGPEDSDEEAKAVVRDHLQLSHDAAGAVAAFFK